MRADSHLHSFYSVDSDCPMENMVKRGIEIGLDEMTFTEHVEHDKHSGSSCDYESYFSGIGEMQKKYRDQIKIKKGIEFGVQTHTTELFEKDMSKYDFDFIIMSTHSVENEHIAYREFEKGKTQDEFHQRYYQNLYKLVQMYKGYSILGHLDYIKRYDRFGEGDYPDEKILDLVEKILRQVIVDGKGIEVNTSSFKYGLKDLMPSRRILELYHELGGKIITIGSDSHDVEHIGDHIEEIKGILKEIGFTEFCTLEKMKPVFHEL